MLEEIATVVEAEGDCIWVETQPRSACSHCNTGSCTTSVIARLFGARRNRLRLHNELNAAVGEQVVIGIPDEVLVAASWRAYLVPLAAMILGVALAVQAGLGDFVQALMALGGLFVGLLWMGRVSGSGRTSGRYAPKLLRLAGLSGLQVELPE